MPLAYHLSCAHFTASLKYHRCMKHIPLIHNYVWYLYRKTLRIKKVEIWFYNVDSFSGFFFGIYLLLGAIFWLIIAHTEDGYLPKTHLSGAILHTVVDTGLALVWSGCRIHGWRFLRAACMPSKSPWALSCPLCLLLLFDWLLWFVCQLWILPWWPSVFVASFSK